MNRKSTMAQGHTFARVPKVEIPRSSFDRSHGVTTCFDAGYLIPVLVDEVLPGDTFNVQLTAFARLTTPVKPVMDNLYLDSFFFAVPLRLVWSNFQKFCGEQTDPGDSIDFTIPVCTVPAGGYNVGKFEDYCGIPTGIDGFTHSALVRRAYFLIWNEWFRDENLQDSVTVSTGDGPDSPASGGTTCKLRGKRHDYFTSCLPWPQKGTAVSLPLGTTADLQIDSAPTFYGETSGQQIGYLEAKASSDPSDVQIDGASSFTAGEHLTWNSPGLSVDLSSATAATIGELRQAVQIQRLMERDARGGTRYTEIVKSHFGVTSPDARLQRPEYLGGGSTPILFSAVPQTSETNTTAQGNLAAYATASAQGHGFVKSFTEHCILIGLVSVRADLRYQQGLERMWSRSTRYDFYWPALAYIGEQAVLNKEIYLQGTAADSDTFGYQERYAEYRYKPSRVTGLMRSGVAGTLDIWHLAQEFGSLPTLNATFINESPPIDRVVATPTEPHLYFDGWFRMKCARPMPVFGVPGFMDHF